MSIGPWDFTGFDVVVLLVVFISLLMAASRGLFRELISIAALLGSGFVTLLVMNKFRFAAQDFIKPSWLADVALAGGAFVISYMIFVFLLGGFVKKLKGKDVGFVDRLLGAGFGAGRGLLLAALATMAFTASYKHKKELYDARAELPPGTFEKLPVSLQSQMQTEPELPALLKGSTLFPLLDGIGDVVRPLIPSVTSMAQRLKDGDIEGVIEDINVD